MKLFAALISSVLLLTGCSSTADSSSPEESISRSVPLSCEIDGVIAAFDEQVEGSFYVPTDWQPGEGTDLDAALDAGGIACSYGIQVAEVGGTIMWAPADDELWATRSAEWQGFGHIPVDLEGFNEDEAYILQDGTSADEMHVWMINFLIDEMWIQIGATFLQTVEEASGLIAAAIAATE